VDSTGLSVVVNDSLEARNISNTCSTTSGIVGTNLLPNNVLDINGRG
jgi:hypothetical protein